MNAVSDRLFALSQDAAQEDAQEDARDGKGIPSWQALDKTGNVLTELARQQLGKETVIGREIVDDSIELIQDRLLHFCSSKQAPDLILTTGGTGFGVRDCTPEAIRKVIQKEASGLSIAMMTASLQKTPLAALSRPVCGVRGNTLIVSLPGSSKGSSENLQAILPILPHALDLVRGSKGAGEAFHTSINGPHPATAIAKNTEIINQSVIHNCSHHHKPYHPDITDASGARSNDPSQSVTKRARSSPFPMIPYSDALELVLKHAASFHTDANENSTEFKSINDPSIIGCILAQDITSTESVPSYRASVVDGYAVVHSDGPGVYHVTESASVATSLLSKSATLVESGKVARITTGAPVPDGATAVVMVEDTYLTETALNEQGKEYEVKVEILASVQQHENIRPVGCDVAIGQTVLTKGQVITSLGGEIGVLASIGVSRVSVYRKPRVAILSTGNEVLDSTHTGPIQFGGIRDANRPALFQIIQANGFDVVDMGIAGDSVEALEMVMREALEKADVLVTTGGVSMGEMDLLKPVIERRFKGKIEFGRVGLKPGKPTTFATIPFSSSSSSDSSKVKEKLVFALPGNPVSALVTFQLFVLVALRRMAGHLNPQGITLKVKISHDINLDFRPEFYRVILSNTGESHWIATGTGNQQSSRILSMASASALLQLPPKSDTISILKAGSLVDCLLIN